MTSDEDTATAKVESVGLLDGPDRMMELALHADGRISLDAEDAVGQIRLTLTVEELERIRDEADRLLDLYADLQEEL